MTDRLEVFYDGDCGLCRRALAWALARDTHEDLVPRDFRSIPEEDLPRSLAEHRRRLWSRAPDGTLAAGWAACREVLRRLPGWRWLATLTSAPPASWIGELGYRLVARTRSWIPLPGSPPSREDLAQRTEGQPGAGTPSSDSRP